MRDLKFVIPEILEVLGENNPDLKTQLLCILETVQNKAPEQQSAYWTELSLQLCAHLHTPDTDYKIQIQNIMTYSEN